MTKYVLIVVASITLTGHCFGQNIVSGRVVDAMTNEPLPHANVFLNYTTIGTVTDDQGKYSLTIPRGEYEMVFSFIGYHSQKLKTPIDGDKSDKLEIKLLPASKELQSVTVHGTADKEWNKLIKRFNKLFLGESLSATQCTIRNPWFIELETKKVSGKRLLFAQASQPLEVENLALGYKIFYDLLEFIDSDESLKFSGNVYFVELEPKDSMQYQTWAQNRRNAYLGSNRHFFKSILQGKVKEEGFTAFSETPPPYIKRVELNSTPIRSDSASNKFRIPINKKIFIGYQPTSPSGAILNGGMNFPKGYVEVDEQGVVLDPLSFTSFGYLSNYRIANLLPYNYEPALVAAVSAASRTEIQNNSYGGPSAVIDTLQRKAYHYSEGHPAEKVYLHLDKAFYFKGEDCWYKAYVVGSDLHATNISNVLYVDWIDASGNIVNHKRLKIENGAAAGDFAIDTMLQAGTYTVRSYTNWMRNEDPRLFFSRQIQIFDPAATTNGLTNALTRSPIDLQFFPEGGTLVAGIKSEVAYKAIDANGRGIDVSGNIIDERNKLVTTFKSSHKGMGSFPLIADLNKSFRAVLESGEVYRLPTPTADGITLAASNMDPNKILVRIQRSNTTDEVVYLIGQSRGSVCYAQPITLDHNIKEVAILKKEIPEGLLQLTLFNSVGIPQCERMMFIKKQEDMVVTINSDNEEYSPRDSIIFTISVNDHQQNPVQSSLSLSITDADLNNVVTNSENIYTRLLLQSDLKGHVDDPGWYFQSLTVGRTYALDLVMLTHGWSRYNWEKILNPNDNVQFPPEKGITLRGNILTHNNPVANAPFIFMIPALEHNNVNIYETDSLGYFEIPDLDVPDTTMVSWRVMKRKGSYVNPKIKLTEAEDIPDIEIRSQNQIPSASVSKLLEKTLARFNQTGAWKFGSSRMLDEIVVKAKRINVASVGRNVEVVKPTPADLLAVTSEFVNRYAPGIMSAKLVRVSEDQEIWTLPSGGRINISIDGYMGNEVARTAINPYLLLNTIRADQVEDLLVSGDPHNGYFIAITTKDPSKLEAVGTIKQTVRGYDIAREFYHPRYGPLDASTPGPDNRITLYWNPNLQTDKNGTAIVKFYNNDATQKLNVVVEGIVDGNVIYSTRIIGDAD